MKKAFLILLAAALLACPALASESPQENPLDSYDAEVTREATCAESGLITYTDPVRGGGFTIEIPPTGEHDYEEVRTEPTCVDPGSVTYTCRVCGDTYTEEIPPTGGHHYVYQHDAEQNADGTFSFCGTWRCEVCGDETPADEADAVYYYGLTGAPETQSGTEEEPAETPEEALREMPGDAPAEEPAEVPVGESAEDPVEEPAEEPDADAPAGRRNGTWVTIEIAAALFLIAEIVLLILSLRKKEPY